MADTASKAPADSLAGALAILQTQLPRVAKNAENPHFRRRYADLAAISAALLPIMGALGLSFSCKLTGSDMRVFQAALRHAPSGESDVASITVPDSLNVQQTGSYMTYMRRYQLCAMTGLVADEDDDGDQAAEEPRPRASTQTEAQQRATRSGTKPPAAGAPRRRAIAEEKARAQALAQPPMERHQGPTVPEEDIWQLPLPEETETKTASASKLQVRLIQMNMGKMNVADADRHEYARALMGWDQAPGSFNDLTYVQAGQLLNKLTEQVSEEKAYR